MTNRSSPTGGNIFASVKSFDANLVIIDNFALTAKNSTVRLNPKACVVVTHLCLFTFDEPEGPEQVDAGNLDFQQSQSHRNTAPRPSSKRKPIVRPVLQLLLGRESVRVKLLGFWPYLGVIVYGIDGYADDGTFGDV